MVYRGRIEGGQVVTDSSDLLPEGARVSIEVIPDRPQTGSESQSPDGANDVDSRVNSCQFDAIVSSEALSFCREHDLLFDLSRAIDIAKRAFLILGSPAVDLVHDRETDGLSYLCIEIQVCGAVQDNVIAHRKFAQESARVLGARRETITLNYNII